MIALETNVRNQAMLRLLYSGGLRVSELSALTWKDLSRREDGGQMTVFGKGGRLGWGEFFRRAAPVS